MKAENLNHIKENVELFRMYVNNNEHLQNSMDVLQPVMKFTTRNSRNKLSDYRIVKNVY